MKIFQKVFVLTMFLVSWAKPLWAQGNNNFEAKIIKVVEEREIEIEGHKQLYQKLEVKLTNGFNQEEIIIVENGHQPLTNVIIYKENDKVAISINKDLRGKDVYTIVDFVRKDGLVLLAIIFVLLTIRVARLKGIMLILSMMFTFGVVFVYTLPQLSLGRNPIILTLLSSVIVILISFYMTHGINQKTTVAIVSSILSLGITAGLAVLFINLERLTGLASEEAGMLLIPCQE